ncbi:MAG: aspartate kinase [Planctomycetaceae bacterium]|nr:aspartate kinase [Planctomycetaceae bacterium]
MSLIVQKFGGTSVADCEKILAAARKAIRAQQDGHQVVMVVSAMGKNTDMLVDLAGQITERPPAREMDMLLSTGEQVSVALMAMAIDSLGFSAVSLTGAQIGIRTDSTHTKARILSISTDRLQHHLDAGKIVIAAGFQGIDEEFNITTLGRGGSDTTAVALAAVLHADACEIHTDVDGVYTTDPRIMPEARRVSRVSYDEMLELASLGAGVMHSRSIEFAKKFSVPIHVRSSFSDIPGTMIVSEPELSDRAVSGAALTRDEAKITAVGVPDVPGTSYEIFSRIADRNVTVDMIVQNIGDGGRADISFTVPRDELAVTLEAIDEARTVTGDFDVTHDDQVAKVSVVGMGMATQAGVADRMFLALSEAEINIKMITTSEIKISTLVERDQALAALRAVHNAFALDQNPESIPPLADAGSRPPSDAADIVHQLQNMERLRIDKIDLDDSQGRVTIHGVPNAPGVAERVFREIAEAGIFVDMIVQSYPSDGEANLSFTVPKESIEQSKIVAENLAKDFPSLQVSSSPDVAKLSVSGIGLRSHTGVAIRMFRALSETGINVQMINTSEVRVNVIVDGKDGEKARAALEEVFSDVM